MDGVRSGDEIDGQSQLVKMISSQFNIRYSSYYPDATSKKIRRHAPSWDGSEWESCQSTKKVRCALQQSDCLVLLAHQADRGARLQELAYLRYRIPVALAYRCPAGYS